MSSSNKNSNTRLAVYTVPTAIGTFLLLGENGALNLPNVEILSAIKSALGDDSYKIFSETVKLASSITAGGVSTEFHDRFTKYLRTLKPEELLTRLKQEEIVRKTIIFILEEEKNNPKYEEHKENIERVILAIDRFYDATTNIKPEEIPFNMIEQICNSFNYKAEDLSKEISPLSVNDWENLLKDVAIISDKDNYLEGVGFYLNLPKPFENVLTELAETLALKFSKTFQNYLEQSFAEQSEVFAKFVLDFLKRIDNSQDELKELLAELKGIVLKIQEKVKNVEQIALSGFFQGQVNQAEVISYLNKISRQIDNLQSYSSGNNNGVSFEQIIHLNLDLKLEFQKYVKRIDDIPEKTADAVIERLKLKKAKDLEDLINFNRQTTPYFVEQGNIFQDLDNHFKTHQLANLRGFHGLGKSTTAIKYAEERAGNYDFVLYVLATTNTIENNLAKLADEYLGNEVEGLELHQKAEQFKEHLEKQPNGLIIFDNLEKLEDYEKHFPLQGNCKILYTSNEKLYKDIDPQVEIFPFLQKEAEWFVYKRVNGKQNGKYEDISEAELEKIGKLIDEMGFLPNALNVASAYINEKLLANSKDYSAYDEYIENLRKSPHYYLKQQDKTDWYENGSLIAAYDITLNNLSSTVGKDEDEIAIAGIAKTIIELCAFCQPDDIPQNLIKETVEEFFISENAILPKDIIWTEAIALLKRYDIIKVKYQTEIIDEKLETPIELEDGTTTTRIPFENEYIVFDIHRTLQTVLYIKLEDETKIDYLKSLIAKLKDLLTYEKEFDWKHNTKYVVHAESLLKYQDRFLINNKDSYLLSFNLAKYFDNVANYQIALENYQRSLSVCQENYEEKHHSIAMSYNNLGNVYDSLGRYKDAEFHHQKSLEIYLAVYGEKHPTTAMGYNNLGNLYRSLGRYKDAEFHHQKSLEIILVIYGEKHPTTAMGYNNLGNVYNSLGRYEKSLEFYNKAIKIFEVTLPKEHPYISTLKENIEIAKEKI